MLGPTYDVEWRAMSFVRTLTILSVWFFGLGGLTLMAPIFGGTLLLAFLWKLRHAIRWNRKLRAIARRRRSLPVDIRKRLYQDGGAFIFWDYWRIIDIPELRELRKAYRTDQLIGLLLVPPLLLLASFLSIAASYLSGGMVR
jgi:hypothetical protein